MQRLTYVLGLVTMACIVASGGVRAQVPPEGRSLLGVDHEHLIFRLFPAAAGTNVRLRSTVQEAGPALSGVPSGPLAMPTRQERGTRTRILIGAGIGLFAGFGIGWLADDREEKHGCPVANMVSDDDCRLGFFESGYVWRTILSPLGAGLGALVASTDWSRTPRKNSVER